MTKDKAMQMALDALVNWDARSRLRVIEALRTALAQPEPEPVAWADKADIDRVGHDFWVSRQKPAKDGIPLYFAPIKKEWVGLTGEELQAIYQEVGTVHFKFAMVEEKLKEKNHG